MVKGITRYLPFSWSMDWVQDIWGQQLFSLFYGLFQSLYAFSSLLVIHFPIYIKYLYSQQNIFIFFAGIFNPLNKYSVFFIQTLAIFLIIPDFGYIIKPIIIHQLLNQHQHHFFPDFFSSFHILLVAH